MDAIEGLIGLIQLAIHWRVTLCLLASALAAFALVHLFPWLSGLQGVVLALTGFILGCAWQARNEPHQSQSPTTTSSFVVGLSAFFVGAIWGGASSTNWQSAFAGIIVLALALAAGYYFSLGRVSSRRAVAFGVIACATYTLIVGLNRYVL